MPALAIAAVPALIGGAAKLFGDRANRNAQADQLSDAQAQALKNKQEQDAYTGGYDFAGLTGQALAPQVTTQVGSRQFNNLTAPEILDKQTHGMLQNAYKGRVAEADFVPEGLLENEYQNIALEEQSANQNLANLAAQRGISPELLRIGSPGQRAGAQARSQARLGAEQMKYNRKTASLGDLNRFFAQTGIGQRQKGRESSNMTTTGPANFGAALGLINAGRPAEMPVIA